MTVIFPPPWTWQPRGGADKPQAQGLRLTLPGLSVPGASGVYE